MTLLCDIEPRHDAGGKTRLRLLPGVRGSAAYAGDRQEHRLWLRRAWGEADDGPFALWIGMNPSTAAETVDDPTIRKEQAWTRRAGLDTYIKVNVMSYRSTSPKRLLEPGVSPSCEENLRVVAALSAKPPALIVCAWGRLPKRLRGYVTLVVRRPLAGRPLWCLGTNADGSPKHPLYLPNDTALRRWQPP